MAFGVGVTEAKGTVGVWRVVDGEFGIQDAIDAAEVSRFGDDAAGCGAGAWIVCGLGIDREICGEGECDQK